MTSEVIQRLILRPSKWSAIWLLLVCSMLVAIGLLLAKEEGWKGYLCAGFFALGIPVAIIQLLPGSTYLEITEEGLSFATMYRVTKMPWNIIDKFFVIEIKQKGITVNKMVAFNFVATYDRAKLSRRICTAIAGCEGALPDTYGKQAEELAEILNQCLTQLNDHNT